MKTKHNKSQPVFGFIIFIAGLFFILLTLVNENHHSENATLENDKKLNVHKDANKDGIKTPNQLVNEYLQKTYDTDQINKLNAVHQNTVYAPDLNNAHEEVPFQEDTSIHFENDNLSSVAGKDLKKGSVNSERELSLDSQIQEEIINDKKLMTDQKLSREAYAKAYVEKAKEKGYRVELDDEYRVVSVKKIIEKKKSKSIFELENIDEVELNKNKKP